MDWVRLIEILGSVVPLVYMFFGSVLALYIKDKLKDIHITQLNQEAKLVKHQTEVKDELVEHQTEIRETVIKHIAEDSIQFKHITDSLDRIEDKQK